MSKGIGTKTEDDRKHMVARLRDQFVINGSLWHVVKKKVDNDLYAAVDIAIVADIKSPSGNEYGREIMTICCVHDNDGISVKSYPAEGLPDFKAEKKFRTVLRRHLP